MCVRISAHGGNMEARSNMHTSMATSGRRYLTTLSPHNEPRIYTTSCRNQIGACIYAWLAFWRALGACDVQLTKAHASCSRQSVQGTSLRRKLVLHCRAWWAPLQRLRARACNLLMPLMYLVQGPHPKPTHANYCALLFRDHSRSHTPQSGTMIAT